MGGDKYSFPPQYRLPPDLVLSAYASGIFPMAEREDDPEVFWISPEERGIIPLDNFHVPRSLTKIIKQKVFEIRYDTDFESVISACAKQAPDRNSTWINEPIREAYNELHKIGHCHSVEAWQDNKLVGGLYGVSLGRCFFGESMFSVVSNASKVCLVHLVERLKARGFILLDTQFTTPHLKRFGAIDIPRDQYEKLLNQAIKGQAFF